VSGNLELLSQSGNARCDLQAPGDAFCGIVNPTNGTISPWPFLDKSGNSTYLQGEFYEGGVNLSTLGLGGECFASVASETRSSTSTTATLKDFVLGQFGTCQTSLVTTPSATVASPVTPGTAVTDTAVVTGSGTANPPNPSSPPNVTFQMCGPIATGICDSSDAAHTPATVGATKPLFHCTAAGVPDASCTGADAQGVSRAISDAVNTAASPLAPGRYCFTASWPGDSNYPTGGSDLTSTSECFAVKDTSTTTTAQNWTPNDTATVHNSSGGNASGTVSFTLYEGGDCTGTELHTFSDIALVNGQATTQNTTFGIAVGPNGRTISWRVTYTPTDPDAISGSTSHCETSTVTINDDIGS
jgi:hypothetical protein